MPAHDPAEEAPDASPLLDDLRLATLGEALGEELSSLADAVARGDAGAAAAAAHGLKGMAANFGAERLRRLAEEMERGCGSPGAGDLLAEIGRVADLTSSALVARFVGDPSP